MESHRKGDGAARWALSFFSTQAPAGSDSRQQLPSHGLSGAEKSQPRWGEHQCRTESPAGEERHRAGASITQRQPAYLLGADTLQRALEGHLHWKRASLGKVIAALSHRRAGGPRQEEN